MKTGRPRPIPPERPAGGNSRKEQDRASQPVSTAAIRAQPGSDRSARPRGFAGAIKQLFREVKAALTGKASAAQPIKRRRRSGEDTRGGFRLSAFKIVWRAAECIRKAQPNSSLAFFGDASKTKAPSVCSIADPDRGPMGPGELIAWYRANGYSMEAIREMFPEFFHEPAAPPRSITHSHDFRWEAPDEMDESQRLHLWHQNNQEGEYSHQNEAFHYEPQDHLSLHL